MGGERGNIRDPWTFLKLEPFGEREVAGWLTCYRCCRQDSGRRARAEPRPRSAVGGSAHLKPAGIFLVCLTRGHLSLRILTQGRFPFSQDGLYETNIVLRPFFFFIPPLVLLSWINRERLIHFSRKTGCTKILQVTMRQTCSRTIIFIQGPNNMCSGHLRRVAVLPPPSPLPGADGLVSLSLSFPRHQVGTYNTN